MEASPRPAQPSVPGATLPGPGVRGEAALRQELDALNLQLRSLRSPDLAARAYVESWAAFVAGGVGLKLALDSARLPLVMWPLLGLALLLVVDVVILRVRRRRLLTREEAQLARQRELRRLLGLDELPLTLH